MKNINAVTIAKLLEAHYEGDNDKFNAYATFIADAYAEQGKTLEETIIRKRIDGSYKNDNPIVLDAN